MTILKKIPLAADVGGKNVDGRIGALGAASMEKRSVD